MGRSLCFCEERALIIWNGIQTLALFVFGVHVSCLSCGSTNWKMAWLDTCMQVLACVIRGVHMELWLTRCRSFPLLTGIMPPGHLEKRKVWWRTRCLHGRKWALPPYKKCHYVVADVGQPCTPHRACFKTLWVFFVSEISGNRISQMHTQKEEDLCHWNQWFAILLSISNECVYYVV